MLVILTGSSTDVFAQKKRNWMGFRPLSDTLNEEKKGLFILPLLYYTPDTRWAAGAAGVYYFKIEPRDETEKLTRVSYVQFLADYTQNRQLDLWSVWNIFTRNENYLFKGEARYRNFPDRYFGIGNNTPKSNEEFYSYSLISIKNLALKKIKPDLFVGIDYHYEYEYNFSYSSGGALELGNVTGYRGGTGSALGLVGIYDSRDNAISARSGILAEVSTYFYNAAWGSSFDFVSINAGYHQYWTFRKRHTIATQTKLRIMDGAVPFLDLSTAGNDDILRGYPKNRFRDKNFIGTQVEYRYPLFWRLGGVAFAGVGDVFESTRDLQMRRLKYSLGAGLRVAVNPAERLNIRVDYAIGREGGYLYFTMAESF